MPLISLEIYRHLFANEAAMAEFADTLERATREDDTPLVTFQDRHIATALSPRATERFLSAERPDTSSESGFGHASRSSPVNYDLFRTLFKNRSVRNTPEEGSA
jgi:hypothetical protein